MIVSSQLMTLNEHYSNNDANLHRYVKVSKNRELDNRYSYFLTRNKRLFGGILDV